MMQVYRLIIYVCIPIYFHSNFIRYVSRTSARFSQQLFLEVMRRARPGVENARKLNFNLSSVCILTKNPICILLSEIDRAIYSV